MHDGENGLATLASVVAGMGMHGSTSAAPLPVESSLVYGAAPFPGDSVAATVSRGQSSLGSIAEMDDISEGCEESEVQWAGLGPRTGAVGDGSGEGSGKGAVRNSAEGGGVVGLEGGDISRVGVGRAAAESETQ